LPFFNPNYYIFCAPVPILENRAYITLFCAIFLSNPFRSLLEGEKGTDRIGFDISILDILFNNIYI